MGKAIAPTVGLRILPRNVKPPSNESHAAVTEPARAHDATRTARPGKPTGTVPVLTASDIRQLAPLQFRDAARYELLHEHGRGGLGRVMRAHDKELGRDVAIKELLERSSTAEIRFFREALITAGLEHPGIVPVHEAGRWDDGTPFYAMKLVSGRPLHELIDATTAIGGRLGLLPNVIAVADAIAYAHDHRIIHRDLKPANVIVGEFGETVVIDWGLAKVLDDAVGESPEPYRSAASSELTEAGGVLGTPAYMAPEQHDGRADERSDVYALGGILYQVLTGAPPNTAQGRTPGFPRDTPRDLIAVVQRAMAEQPAARYVTARAFSEDLRHFLRRERVSARRYSLAARIGLGFARYRAAAMIAIAALVVVSTTLAVSVVSISHQRGHAVEARAEAERQRAVAERERDGAELARAALLLDKDPTQARDLLASLEARGPRYALLMSRAKQGAAARVINVPSGIYKLLRSPSSVGLVATNGDLLSVDLDTGATQVLDHDLKGPATTRNGGWVYTRKAIGDRSVTLATSKPRQTLDVGALLSGSTGVLVASGTRLYALDNGDLYALEDRGPELVRHGVRSVVASEHVLMVCTAANELEITRDGQPELRTRCAPNASVWPMAAVGTDYAALLDAGTLLVARGGEKRELPAHISGEYELALTASGVVAVADFSDKTWFVRPGGRALELGPLHASQPTSVAADGTLAAWGYTDGVVVVVDTATGASWELHGNGYAAMHIALDAAHERLMSVAGDELRVFTLAKHPVSLVGHLPCQMFNLARSPDRTQALLDCDDGRARVWTLASNEIREIHRHTDIAFGVAWMRGAACSAGLDGRVLCTGPDGETRELLSQAGRIKWLEPSPDGAYLAAATDDGKLWKLTADAQTLYTQAASPYRMAFTPDGQLLASGAVDGSVIVYDLARHEIQSSMKAHQGFVTSVAWRGHDLWTSSADGTLKRWQVGGGTPVLQATTRDAGSFRFLHVFADGWTAGVDRHVLLIQLPGAATPLRFDLDRHLERIEISPDSRYIAAMTAGEIALIDLSRHAVATLPMAGARLDYAGFLSPDSLVVGGTSGLYTVDLASLDYIAF
jgi:eukaryotic-like serine/threonine-protein kinase